MKVAILHYHLKPGGVTTVVRHQAEVLAGSAQVALVAGEPASGSFPAPVHCLPDLAYDDRCRSPSPPEKTVSDILGLLGDAFGGRPDLIHVHNPTLVKNRRLLPILKGIQAKGVPLLLQVHDFAEDGRPQSYDPRAAYPENAHYAVINPRDQAVLADAGLTADGLHLLPNPVVPMPAPRFHAQPDTVLYPVRAIRRKNIGEALLLSLFMPEGDELAVTLPPNSPSDATAYEDWRAWARNRRLSVRFEAGLQGPFEALVGRARCFVSTSIAEGFGFAFLEPWTAGKPLVGRRLPGILEAFEANGIDLRHLYREIRVPVDWCGGDRLRQRFGACLDATLRRYGQTLARWDADAFVDRILAGGWVDFGFLDEPLQAAVLDRLLQDPGSRTRLTDLNPCVERFRRNAAPDPAPNREAVLAAYSLDRYRIRLLEVYRRVVDTSPTHVVDKAKLVERFLVPENFSLLKWRPYER